MWFIDKIKGVFETRSKPVDQPQTNTLPIVMGKSADTSRTNSSIIFGALNLISNAVARAPIRHLIGYEKIENDDLSFLLNVRPNDYITAMRFWQKIVYDLIWHGNGYAYIIRDRFGQAIAFKELNKEQVQVKQANGLYFYYVTFTENQFDNQPTMLVESKDILHFRGQKRNDFFGVGAYDTLISTIMQNDENKQTYMDLSKKAAKIAGTMEFPAQMNVELIKKHMQLISEVLSQGDNALLPLQPGMKFNETKPSTANLLVFDLFKMTLQEIATALNVPPHMLGDVSGSADVEQLYLEFISMTLAPIATEIQQELSFKLLGKEGFIRKESLEFDLDELIVIEFFKKAQAHDILIRNSIFTVNESRKEFKNKPVKGGNVPFITKNYAGLTEMSDPKGGEQKNGKGNPDIGGTGSGDPDSRRE